MKKRAIVFGLLFMLSACCISLASPKIVRGYYKDKLKGGSGGENGTPSVEPCDKKNEFKEWYGGCLYDRPAVWLKVPVSSDYILESELIPQFHKPSIKSNNKVIKECQKWGGAAFILFEPTSSGQLYPTNLNNVKNKGNHYSTDLWTVQLSDLPPGTQVFEESEVRAHFFRHREVLEAIGLKYDYNTNLHWFCAVEQEEEIKPPFSSVLPELAVTCDAIRTRERGDTKTRIAVRNISLDGASWQTTGSRTGLTSDSGWTDGAANVRTIAKPGDSVQFLHEVCMGNRYARRTAVQNAWTSQQSHNNIYDIPAQSFEINASPNYYLFGTQIANVNAQTKNVTAYDKLFQSTGKGVSVSPDRYAIGVVSPSTDNNAYDCNSISQYLARNPHISSAFHIPGFDSGKCNSASLTTSNTVGKTITQYHDFDSIKVWETKYHTNTGGCGCNSNTYSAGHNNYTAHNFESAPMGDLGNLRTRYCKKDCDQCCGQCIRYKRDKYGRPTKECMTRRDSSWSVASEANNFLYQTVSRNYGKFRKTATAYVPYNFETTIYSGISAEDAVFQGSSAYSYFNWGITARDNPTTSNFRYATVTPPSTEVRAIEFLLPPDTKQNVEGNNNSPSDPCAYFGNPRNCRKIDSASRNGNQNPEGLYNGAYHGSSSSRIIPDDDEYVGYKYCVAVGIYPADSHNYQGNGLDVQTGQAMRAGNSWNISGASCRTIAKKPNYQVWNGSAYTEGSVSSSVSKKITNATFGQEYKGDATHLFGSWTDYAIIAGGKVSGMASGAMLGYDNSKYNLSGISGQPQGTDFSKLSPQTISNNVQAKGDSNINASSSINMNLERLYSRYRDKAKTFASEIGTGSQNNIITAKTGMQFVYVNEDVTTSSLNIRRSNLPNQTIHKAGNNFYKTLGDGINDNTFVIYSTGTVTIDSNLCLAENAKSCADDATRLRTYSETNTNAPARLPQILIFAKDIKIAENVTRVDAWLVADGNINTCSNFSIGTGNSLQCNKTLVVNGPVFAKNLILNRTAGNYHGTAPTSDIDVLDRSLGSVGNSSDFSKGSSSPAEIFNLRADVYIWAYNQAARSSEAVVTYTRELAPRY